MGGDGYNWFLIFVSIVMVGVAIVFNIYLLIHFQHPEDRNQAWLPKAIVLLGLTLAELSVLMLPLDVGNRSACDDSVVLSACNFALPMEELWYAVYMMMFLLVILVIPFTLFYYEADSELTLPKKLQSAGGWLTVTFIVAALTVSIAYAFGGYVEYESVVLISGVTPLATDLSVAYACIAPGGSGFAGALCDGKAGGAAKESWSVRTSFPVYVIAMGSILGWILFMVYAGVGMVALPLDLIKSYVGRPQKTIARSQYITLAKHVGQQAADLKEQAEQLKRQERSGGKGRKLRRAVAKLNQELLELEQKERLIREAFPQGEDAAAKWAMTVLTHVARLVGGILALCITIVWILHMIVFMMVNPPPTTFLNEAFIELDKAFPLFGTGFFALFCIHLVLCVIKGNFKLGMRVIFVTVHPMEFENTLMSSFLFNVGIIIVCSISLIQFCAKAFNVYANETAIDEIFGDKIENLRGLGVLFKYNVFLYSFFSVVMLSALVLMATDLKPRKDLHNDIRALIEQAHGTATVGAAARV